MEGDLVPNSVPFPLGLTVFFSYFTLAKEIAAIDYPVAPQNLLYAWKDLLRQVQSKSTTLRLATNC